MGPCGIGAGMDTAMDNLISNFREKELQTVVESIRDFATFMLDGSGNVIGWNANAARLTGYDPLDVIGHNFQFFFSTDDPDAIRPERLLRIASGDGLQEEEGWCVRKDGKRFWAGAMVTSIHEKSGQLRGFSIVLEDLETRRKNEEKVQDLFRGLDESNRELSRLSADMEAFTSTVSHDLKEPLRAITAFSQFIEEDCTFQNEECRDHLHRIITAAKRLQLMIDKVFSLSRVGLRPDALTAQDMQELLESVTNTMGDPVRTGQAIIEVSDNLPEIMGERVRLEQIFQNLVSNGLKFNRSDQPKVSIGISDRNEDAVTIYVRDNGIGIAESDQERVFDIFQRVNNKEEFEGTGAGLAIVKRAVESLGGSIQIESELGEGTSFYLTFRLADAAVEAQAA